MSDQLSGELLLHTIEEIERLNVIDAGTKEEKRETFAHAKENGFDPKVIRRIVKHRAEDETEREETEAEFTRYMNLLKTASRATRGCTREESETKDLGDAAADTPKATPVVPTAANGGDPDLLDIPPSLRRPIDGDAPASETKTQEHDAGEPDPIDPFDWPGEIPPEPPTPNEARQ